MFSELDKTSFTNQFLTSISTRLSGRQDTQGCEYHVNIFKSDNHTIVDMAPLYYVYPDRHRRKELDKKTILDWAMHQLFSDAISYKWTNAVQLSIDEDCFVEGCYAYVKYENANKRKWTKSLSVEKAIEIVRKEKFL